MKRIIWLICLCLLPLQANAEHLVLKHGFFIRDTKIVANNKGVIYFKWQNSDRIWELSGNYIEQVSRDVPGEATEIQPSQIGNYFLQTQELEEREKKTLGQYEIPSQDFINTNEVCRIFNSNRREPFIAMGTALLLPSVGHAYAGDWQRGFIFISIEALLLSLAYLPLDEVNSDIRSLSFFPLLFIAKGIEMCDAALTVEDSNNRLRKQLHIMSDSDGTRLGIKVEINF